jgi:hypothetical protein
VSFDDRRWWLLAGVTIAGLLGAGLALWVATPPEAPRPSPVAPPPPRPVRPLASATGEDRPAPAIPRVSAEPRAPAPAATETVPLPSAPMDVEPLPSRKALPPEHDPSVPWPVDMGGIRGAMRDRMPELEDCYRDYLAQHPGTAGRVVANFAITGGVEDAQARIQGVRFPMVTVDADLLERCVAVAVEDLRFEPPDEGRLEVSYPLVFSTDD